MQENGKINEIKEEQIDEREYVSFSKNDDEGNFIEALGYYESSDIAEFMDKYFEEVEEQEPKIRK